MKCSFCGNEIDNPKGLCPNCGFINNLDENTDNNTNIIPNEEVLNREEALNSNNQSNNDNINKEVKLYRIFGIVSIVVALLIFGFYFVPKLISNFTSSNNENSNVEVEKKDITKDEESSISTEDYYKQNSESFKKIEVSKDKNVLSEKEIINYYEKRGFNNFKITYNYDINGNYFEEREVSINSNEKHPLYQMYYISKNRTIWNLTVVSNKIYAYNLSEALDSENRANSNILLSESEKVITYDSDTNTFFETIPKKSKLEVKVVKKIDSDTLENYKSNE